MAIPYVKQTWTDGVSSASAARMGVLEQGAYDAHNMPKARVTKAAAQTGIVTVTMTALTFDTERVDVDGLGGSTIHDNSTNPTRLTARVAGFYLIGGGARWSASPVIGTMLIRLNGTTWLVDETAVTDNRSQTVCTGYQLAVNDYVELVVQQQSGSNKDITKSGNDSPEFWMVRLA